MLMMSSTRSRQSRKLVHYDVIFQKSYRTRVSNYESGFQTSVIADVPIEDRVSGVEIAERKYLPTQKTLGVTWNAETDTFTFQVQPPTNSMSTKRSVLSCIASLFDPL